ncbi:RNA-binding domain-containing protein [Testicularia cyperi]|uniref:Probable RNA-binding protein 18 n=1 Tax=Testicularia cyperi TaxID=1882483 RepID=A0A317XL38_9BASI|nr:RNA-binding domain-containing protein [Testicularia cyperi]
MNSQRSTSSRNINTNTNTQSTGTGTADNPYLSRQSSSATSGPDASRLAKASTPSSRHDTRLYVGNLHPSVDEYALIQTFSRYGKIIKLDYLFHKSGPLRGQPRGYAFVEYATKDEALEAVAQANNGTLRGKRISVSFASQSATGDDQRDSIAGAYRHSSSHRDRDDNASKQTNLSMIKNAARPTTTDAKIAAMEAKLAKLRSSSQSQSISKAEESGSLNATSTKKASERGVSSLPAKPPPSFSSSRPHPYSSSRRP